MIMCPNFNNPEVAREFEELKNATSENAAYHIWSMNNGYNIDSAPNGEPSILFQTLLDLNNGDRLKAILAKAKVYANSFIKWFGDWTLEDKTNVSKVVDENGEPLVVWHGSKYVNDATKEGDWSKNVLPYATYFAPQKYANGTIPYYYAAYLNMKNPFYTDADFTEEMIQDEPFFHQFITNKSHDGAISKINAEDAIVDYINPRYAQEIVVINPNQIKSIENKGSFGTKEDNIYGEYRSTDEIYDAINQISDDRKSAVLNAVSKHLKQNPNATTKDISKVINDTEEQFNQGQQRSIASRTKDLLIESYGLKQTIGEDGRMHYEGDNVIVSFVQYLEDELGEHEGWYDYNSLSKAAHHTIMIALNGNEANTFNHELAHHYIRMFWDTPLIQNALAAVYKDGMTAQEMEEALVDEITSRTGILFQQDVEQQSFYQKFWSKFSEMLAKAFNIKNKTYKENLLNNVTKAYALNENQQSNPTYTTKFKMYNGRMYKDKYAEKKIKAKELKRQERNKRHYEVTRGDRKDQKAVKIIVEGAIHRKSILSNSESITDKEVVSLNVFEQEVKEFAKAIEEQRKVEFERLRAEGKTKYAANRKKSDSEREKELNINIIKKFLDNAQEELEVAISRFESARSAMYMKVTSRLVEDSTTGDITTQYVNASEYGEDENVTQKEFTYEELSRLGRELITYYEDVIAEIDSMLGNRTIDELYSSELLEELRDRKLYIEQRVNQISRLYKEALEERMMLFVDNYVDNMPGKLDEERKYRLKLNMRRWLNGQYDLGMGSNASLHRILEAKIGVAEWSQSPIIRMMNQMIVDLNIESEDLVLEKKNKLFAAREKAKKALVKKGTIKQFFSTFDKMFMEVDENGRPTGNLLSSINKGMYYKKRSDFVDELLYSKGGIEDKIRNAIGNPNYELELDSNGNPSFPNDPRVTKYEIEYLVKYNEFLCDNTHRRYTPKYYRERLRILCDLNDDLSVKPTSTTKALHAQNEIQSQIDKIIIPCIVKGKPHTELLDDSQLEQLLILENERSLLSSPYDNRGNEKEEGTEEHEVYIRLKAWKDFLKDKNIVYSMNQELFEESLSNAKNKKQFRRLNTYRKISDRFWEIYQDELGTIDDEELNKLRERRSQLVSIIKPRGLSKPNLDIVWDEVNGQIKPEWQQFFLNLKELDIAISKRLNKLRGNKKFTQKQAAFIDSMIDKREAMKDQDTWYEHMSDAIKKRYYRSKIVGAKQKADEEIEKYLRYKDSEGKNRQLSIFSTTYPKLLTLKDNEGEFSTIERIPIRAYSLLDVEASDKEWVNKDYQSDSDQTVQPNEKYINKKYNEVLGKNAPEEVKQYYELLKTTMEESYQNILFLGKYNDMLPQRAARTSSILSRNKIWKTIPFIVKRWFDITENDTDINEVIFKQRKNKTITGSVPVRYIKRLDHPEYVSGDLLSSVLSFYSMSLNYKGKRQLAPIMTLMHEQMLKTDINSEQANVAKGMIYRQIYGKNKTGIPDGVLTKGLKRLIKGLGLARVGAMISLLGFGGLAATVAVLDALTSGVVDVTTRRSFGYSDLLWTIGKMMRQSIPMLIQAGSVKSTTFGLGDLPAALESFGLSGDIAANTMDSDMNQFRRLFKEGLSGVAFIPFSLGENLVNSFTLCLNLSSYKFYKGEFLSREDFMKKAMGDGLTRNQARVLYHDPRNRLFNAYHTDKEGNFVPNPKNKYGKVLLDMDPKEYRKLKNRLTSKGISKAASYNALIPETERTELQSNIIWNWITMVRNFLLIGFWERFAKLNDFYLPDSEEMSEGEKLQMRSEQAEYSGGINMMTGEITNGRARAFSRMLFTRDNGETLFLSKTFKNIGDGSKYIYNQISKKNFDKYEYRQEHHLSEADLHGFHIAITELFVIGLFMTASAAFHNKFVDDYDDEYWFLFVDLILLRMPLERITMWHPDTVMEIITSITAGKTLFDRFGASALIKLAVKDYKEHGTNYSDYEKVLTGGFLGETILFRETLKTFSWLGMYNLYRTMKTESIKSSKNFYKKLGSINPSSWWRNKSEEEGDNRNNLKPKRRSMY